MYMRMKENVASPLEHSGNIDEGNLIMRSFNLQCHTKRLKFEISEKSYLKINFPTPLSVFYMSFVVILDFVGFKVCIFPLNLQSGKITANQIKRIEKVIFMFLLVQVLVLFVWRCWCWWWRWWWCARVRSRVRARGGL